MKDLPDSLVVLRCSADALLQNLAASAKGKIETSHPELSRERTNKGQCVSFDVKFSDLPNVTVAGRFNRRGWNLRCSCPSKSSCWHLLAACICQLESKGVNLPAEYPKTGKEADSASGTSPASATPMEPTSARSSNFQSKQNGLHSVVANKLGRTLSASEQAYLAGVEKLFLSGSQYNNFSAEALKPFCGGKSLPIWELIELWPAPPKNVWEAWLYIACFLKSRQFPLPGFLETITHPDELQQLADGWAFNQMLHSWEENVQRILADLHPDQDDLAEANWDLRLVLGPRSAYLQARKDPEGKWELLEEKKWEAFLDDLAAHKRSCSEAASTLAEFFRTTGASRNEISYHREDTRERIVRMLLNPSQIAWICTRDGDSIQLSENKLEWKLQPVHQSEGTLSHHQLVLTGPDGTPAPAPWFFVGGKLNCYLADGILYRTAPLLRLDPTNPFLIPAAGLHSEKCVQLLQALGVALPEEVAARIVRVQPQIQFHAKIAPSGLGEILCVQVSAVVGAETRIFADSGWEVRDRRGGDPNAIVSIENRLLKRVPKLLEELGLRSYLRMDEIWQRAIGKRFPEEFCEWIQTVPPEIELFLDPELNSLRDSPIAGSLRLEIEEGSPDWFDVRVALAVTDTELTEEEIQLLMQAKGEYVRLSGKGWRRLDFQLGDDEAAMLEEMGLNPYEIDSTPQRFHTIQLVRSKAQVLMGSDDRSALQRRAADLKLDCTPSVPQRINATLRPYQIEGFHFLVYLSSNRFGGILADDMGLGKTLQTLCWIQWLREQPEYTGKPVLVVCPKSVVQNWLSESQRFLPGLRASVWKGGDLANLRACRDVNDLVVVNYTQLRLSANVLGSPEWHAVVLDEAQYIKNPSSQTAVAACALRGNHRLALSGTPIENRLMDLWSILQFCMPGLLGVRTQFQKRYDSRTDTFARRRLSSRVRPFVLRRTKAEVAADLPARIEEDLVVEMEGTQALLYSAELKRARQELLKIKTSKDLDKQRFHVLTSLLRLRQICCHPGLVSDEHGHADSAKLDALVDLLEPLMEEGHKVLVFSQFVEMLDRIEREIDARGWQSFLLTGETENRGELVDAFQSHEGSAVFLISLRAGGMGLNLTAASYVILYDPWWNPAVENQAIDRTHRIGQTQQVIAYRLIARNSVEQKIRQLQQSKCALAGDILGEESLAKALSIEDFRFLIEE